MRQHRTPSLCMLAQSLLLASLLREEPLLGHSFGYLKSPEYQSVSSRDGHYMATEARGSSSALRGISLRLHHATSEDPPLHLQTSHSVLLGASDKGGSPVPWALLTYRYR